jgi:hypothetical protein
MNSNSTYRADVEACTWWDPDTGQVLSGAEVVARCTLEPEAVMVLGPEDFGYEVFNKPQDSTALSTLYVRLSEAQEHALLSLVGRLVSDPACAGDEALQGALHAIHEAWLELEEERMHTY